MNWLFTDMNSYFASVEQYLRPELRNHPVAVIPVETDSTCVIAASYSAKQFGVKTGTKVSEARRLCPGLILVKARPKTYVSIHHEILETLSACAPIHKVYSIDEWSIRLRGAEQQPAQAHRLALTIKQTLFEKFGPWMTCSIGIATSRLLAKIASDLQKPDGLTILDAEQVPVRLARRPLKSLCGIGDGMLSRLQAHGVQTPVDLWNLTREEANRVWGSVSGGDWWAGFHGIDEPEIPTRRSSMSHGNVLEPRFRHPEGAYGILIRLVTKLGVRLRRDGYFAKCLQLSLRTPHGERFTEKMSIPYTHDTTTLIQQVEKLWRLRPNSFSSIQKVDVCVSGLVLASQVPRSLFDEVDKRQQVSQVVDKINARLGEASIYFGPVHHFRQQMDNKIAFGRIPDRAE